MGHQALPIVSQLTSDRFFCPSIDDQIPQYLDTDLQALKRTSRKIDTAKKLTLCYSNSYILNGIRHADTRDWTFMNFNCFSKVKLQITLGEQSSDENATKSFGMDNPLCQVACSCHSTQEWSWSLLAIDKDLFASPPKKNSSNTSLRLTVSISCDFLLKPAKPKMSESEKWKKLPSPFRATREKMVESNIEYKLFASFIATNRIFHQKNYYQIPILLPSPNQNLSKNPRTTEPPPQKKQQIFSPIEFQASVFFQYLPVHQRSVARMHFLSPGTMRRRSPWLREPFWSKVFRGEMKFGRPSLKKKNWEILGFNKRGWSVTSRCFAVRVRLSIVCLICFFEIEDTPNISNNRNPKSMDYLL